MITTTPPESLSTRERLLAAALTCFSRKGYHQTTTDEIVAESGMGKGTLYRYFSTKQELFVSLVNWMMFEMYEEMAHINLSGLPASDQLRKIAAAVLDDMEQLLPFYKITLDFWAQTTEVEAARQMFSQLLTQFQMQLTPIVEGGIASGEFQPVDVPQALLGLIAMLDGLGLYKALLGDDINLRATIDTGLEIFLAGLQNVRP